MGKVSSQTGGILMKYETYEKICKKHKINPHQVIADGNIREILENDKDHNLDYYEILLDQYFKVFYEKGEYVNL